MGSALTMREVEAVELETEVINSAELARRLACPRVGCAPEATPSEPTIHPSLQIRTVHVVSLGQRCAAGVARSPMVSTDRAGHSRRNE